MFNQKEYDKERYQKHKAEMLAVHQKWAQTEKGKLSIKESTRKYKQTKKGKIVNKKYNYSTKGKVVDKKHQAKRNRNLGFTPLMSNPFPKEILIDYHHINNAFVVPVPRQVHKSMLGKNHRVKVNNWIEEIIGDVGVC